MKTRVICLGVATLDIVMAVNRIPLKAGKYRTNSANIVGGGMAANAAVAVARLGGSARLVSRLGQDPMGDQIISELKSDGVDCSLIQQFHDIKTSFSSVYVDSDGERQLVNFRDPKLPVSPDWVTRGLNQFDAILSDPRWPEGAHAAMLAAKNSTKPGIIDAESPALEAKDALMIASHIAFSAEGLRDYGDTGHLEEGLIIAERQLQGFVAVTDGENGVYWRDNGRTRHSPAFNVPIVDTLGAGDVWHGAFALELADQTPIAHAIRFANAAAALKCMKPGGRTGAPTRDQVDTFLQTA